MNQDSLASYTWICPACGRRVPRRVEACRCGHPRPEAEFPAPTPEPPATHALSRTAVLGAVAIVLLGATIGWYYYTQPTLPAFGWMGPPARPAPSPAPDSAAAPTTTPLATPPAATPMPAVSVIPPPVPADAAPATGVDATVEDLIARVTRAVVGVKGDGRIGSGFFVAPDTVITNVHVIVGATEVVVRRDDGTTTTARVVAASPAVDIAVLKVAAPVSTQVVLPLGAVARVRSGQEVFAVGSPLGVLQNSVTRGIVSAIRELAGVTVVQTDAAINPGNSGGPLINRQGEVVGVTTLRIDAREGLSFAVAADHALALMTGRPVPASGGLATVTALGPALESRTPSTADAAREEGTRIFEEALTLLSRRADTLDRDWAGFKRACYGGTIGGSYDREWFAVVDPASFTGIVARGCEPALAEWRQIVDAIHFDITTQDEAARKAGVYPGVRRAIRERLRLDFPARTP
jgi:S1-C subfamily serine protease